jgi:hypothetical protein
MANEESASVDGPKSGIDQPDPEETGRRVD